MTDERGFAPSIQDIEFDELSVYWIEEMGLTPWEAKVLALYQYTGGNAFGLTDLDGNYNYAPRGEC